MNARNIYFSSGSVLLKKHQQLQQQPHHHHGPSNLSHHHLKQQPQLHPLAQHYHQQEYSPVITGNHQVDSLTNGSTNLAGVVTTSEAAKQSSTKSVNISYPVNSTFATAVADPQVQNVLTQPSLHVKQVAAHTIENVAAAASGMAIHHVDIGTPSTDGEIIPTAKINAAGRIKS